MASLTDWMPAISTGVGGIIGGAMNFGAQAYQNYKQVQFYDKYMSPQARMAQMLEAGINPNAAAQGISGASAPQMNAAAPTSAFSDIGRQLGESFNSYLSAKNLVANTNKVDEETRGQRILNDIAETELENKPEMLRAQIDDLKESANQKRQQVEQSKAEISKINEEIENLKKEREYMVAQIGLVEYEKRLKDAETRAANAKAALDSANKELSEVNKEIQEKERDNYLTPEERITKEGEAQEKVAVAAAKAKEEAHVENDPETRSKEQLTKQYEKESAALQKEIDGLENELNKYRTGRKKDNYFGTNRSTLEYKLKSAKARLQNLTDEYHKNLRRYNTNKGISVGLHGVSKSD